MTHFSFSVFNWFSIEKVSFNIIVGILLPNKLQEVTPEAMMDSYQVNVIGPIMLAQVWKQKKYKEENLEVQFSQEIYHIKCRVNYIKMIFYRKWANHWRFLWSFIGKLLFRCYTNVMQMYCPVQDRRKILTSWDTITMSLMSPWRSESTKCRQLKRISFGKLLHGSCNAV